MSAHSFPSLTSDSSSIPSRSSDPHESHIPQDTQGSVSSRSRASKQFPFEDSDTNTQVRQLRNRVSKLEQDKFVLGDYAAELQSRIRHLERERMEHHHEVAGGRELTPENQKAESRLSSIVRTSLSRPSTPTGQSRTVDPLSASYHRGSSSLSAATSATAKRALSQTSHRKTPSPTPSQLAFPSSTPKLRLVPKRGSRPVALDPLLSAVSEPPPHLEARRDSEYENLTPTRRRLQAMYGRNSLDATPRSPTPNGGGPSNYPIINHEPRPTRGTHFTRIPNINSKHSPHEHAGRDHDPELKRTAFTSKLDSIILTSKLFPISSSRAKAPLAPVSPDHHIPVNNHTSSIPFAHSGPSSSPPAGNVFLDSPPNKNAKVKLPQKGKKSLSHSLGLEENRHPDSHFRKGGPKPDYEPRGRISFSEYLFSSSSDREDDAVPNLERPGRMWGSWGRKIRQPPPPLLFNKEKRTTPTPPSAFPSQSAKFQGTDSAGPDEKRRTKRHSVAAGCLRSIVRGSSQRGRSTSQERRVLRRSHSESRKSHSRSPSHTRAPPDHTSALYRTLSPRSKDKPEKQLITPSRVGSPKPKGRMPELQRSEELERTNSLRSAGRWGQRGRGFAKELTRRRTIHPMFSFERPGSSDAMSTSSSRRADDEQTGDEHHEARAADWTQVEKLPRRAQPPAPEPPPRSPTESGVSHSHATHAQGDSLCSGGRSGHTGGVSRAETEPVPKVPMVRTRLGAHHGTFAFEPAAAVVHSPRSAPPTSANRTFTRGGSLLRGTRSGASHEKAGSEPATDKAVAYGKDQVYHDFCEDLMDVLGNGEEWTSFKKYIRRFDLEVLSAEVLLQRVKKLIDGSPADRGTKLKLYDRFVKIVHDNLEQRTILGS